MQTQIKDLVSMHDVDSLFEIMFAGDDEFLQLDAAEGLVQLGDGRGLKFLEKASKSNDKDLRDYAGEIMADPGMQRMREQVEADVERQYQARVDEAKKRIQKGKKVFRYKVIFVPATDILQEDYGSDGTSLPDLDDAGLQGWEVVNVVARRQLLFDVNDEVSGAYAILKKEVATDESAELDEE
jgi:hypothetical protein